MTPTNPTIIIDTREQTPLPIEKLTPHIPTERRTLKTGDYSIEGFEDRIVIERKSVNDFLGSIASDRFWREMDRLSMIHHRVILIDNGSLQSFTAQERSTLTYNTAIGYVNRIMEEYGTHVIFASRRPFATHFAAMWLLKCYKLETGNHVVYPKLNMGG